MGKTQTTKAEELIIRLIEQGQRKMTFNSFILEIRRSIGGDMKRTVKPYFELMQQLGMIQPVEEKEERYVIILSEAERN